MTCDSKLKPFLLRFKSSTGSTRKRSIERNRLNNFQYDPKLSQIVTFEEDGIVAVIHSKSSVAPITKKRDDEDGDDRKDSWIWE